ncbi:MAG TPA: hypothetical protein DEH24_06180 [Alteromonas sp.]|jgi:hypothetical protein|nr:hypothetical protein [Alteromonadaceae bacterium]MAX44521.1 hypothetical protein [Alteromonadaceae bacterium]HBY38982.1 hypothetical protein [Alteromonas sp.]|tara:strand:- start:72 stop:395 length:324 start_codon:yes stop_codon:yes gene_type:complete
METSVKRLSPHSFALHTALVFAIIALLFILPMTLFMNAMTPNMPDGSMPAAMFGVMTFVMPVMYFVFTYIFGFLGALIYNLIAKKTGGIRCQLEMLPVTNTDPTEEI